MWLKFYLVSDQDFQMTWLNKAQKSSFQLPNANRLTKKTSTSWSLCLSCFSLQELTWSSMRGLLWIEPLVYFPDLQVLKWHRESESKTNEHIAMMSSCSQFCGNHIALDGSLWWLEYDQSDRASSRGYKAAILAYGPSSQSNSTSIKTV